MSDTTSKSACMHTVPWYTTDVDRARGKEVSKAREMGQGRVTDPEVCYHLTAVRCQARERAGPPD